MKNSKKIVVILLAVVLASKEYFVLSVVVLVYDPVQDILSYWKGFFGRHFVIVVRK